MPGKLLFLEVDDNLFDENSGVNKLHLQQYRNDEEAVKKEIAKVF